MARKKTIAPIKDKRAPVCYVGPSIKELGLFKGAVFFDGIEKKLLQKTKNRISFRMLFVPAGELGKALLDVKIKGTALNLAAQKIMTEFNTKREVKK